MTNHDHSDELDRLRSLAAAGQGAAQGLPGEKVRALGGRRHRRRVTAVLLGTAVVIAAVAGGAVAALGGLTQHTEPVAPAPTLSEPPSDDESNPPTDTSSPSDTTPSTSPTDPEPSDPPETSEPDSPVQVIPDDYPLDRKLPDYGGDGSQQGPRERLNLLLDPRPCGARSFLQSADVADQRMLQYRAPEVVHSRALLLFQDEQQAALAMQEVARAVDFCPEDEMDDGVTVVKYQREATSIGDESLVIVRTQETNELPALGTEQHHFVRVGNAVMMVNESGEYMYDSKAGRDALRELTQLVDTLEDDMSALSAQ